MSFTAMITIAELLLNPCLIIYFWSNMASGQACILDLKVSGENTCNSLFSGCFPVGVPFQPIGFVL